MKSSLTGFDIERLRKKLLAQRKIKELLRTYTQEFPEIIGENTPDFWDEKFTGDNTTLFPMAWYRNKIVAASIAAGARVLNLGVGKGYLERFITNRSIPHISLTATDFTKITLRELKREFPQITFVTTGLLDLPFKDNSFDTVCLLEVLEHIAPKQTFTVLQEIYRVLKKHGTVIVSVPVNEGLEAMMPYNPNAHKRDYSKELVAFEIEHMGFKVVRIETLSAFGTFFYIKHFINKFFKLRNPNNIIIWAQKVK